MKVIEGSQGGTIASRLREVVEAVAQGNNAQFGRALGVSGQIVGQWLDGTVKNPVAYRLFEIEDRFGYSARWLATGERPKFVKNPDQRRREICRLSEALSEGKLDPALQVLRALLPGQ
jgi:transcriptional regulator with XRE-family HTH domain